MESGRKAWLEALETRALLSAVFADGVDNDIVRDAAGTQHLAYRNDRTGHLMYASRPNGGSWSSPVEVDSSPLVGYFVAIAVDTQNRPGMAYYDANQGDLKYAKFNGSSWTVQTVDSGYTTGYYPSLVFNASDTPIISYYYKTGGDLRLTYWSGSSWATSTLDNVGDVGRYTSIAIQTTTGYWGIAYENTTNGDFRYIRQTKGGGNSGPMDVDTGTANGGGYTSLAFDYVPGQGGSDVPTFTYYDSNQANLKFAKSSVVSPATTADWTTTAIAGGNNQSGMYSNLWYEAPAVPKLTYYNETEDAIYMMRRNGASAPWDTPTPIYFGGGRESEAIRLPAAGEMTFTFVYISGSTYTLYVNDTNTGEGWQQATNASVGGRMGQGSTVFTDPIDGHSKMWIAGGSNSVNGIPQYKSDVWRSTDGSIWTQATSQAEFGARTEATLLSFNGYLWMIGGTNSSGAITDGVVYRSTNGLTWQYVSSNLPAVYAHGATVFTDPADSVAKMWIVGGRNSAGTPTSTVYKSADGVTWTAATTSAAFGARFDEVLLTHNGKLWVIAGTDGAYGTRRDVWSSDDGASWTQETASGAFGLFSNGSGMVYDNRLWVVLGEQIWYSFTGAAWTRATAAFGGAARQGHSSLVFDAGQGAKMWVMAGQSTNPTTYRDDVWYAS